MTSLTFYGGVNEIGGNKILLEDGKTRIFFDFGLSFMRGNKFYTGFLRTRNVAGAKDDLELGLIPKISGLYSKEMLKFTDLKYEEPKFDAIFISHPHMDHCSHLQYIDENIPIHCGECTLRIIESINPGEKEQEALGLHNYRTFRTGQKITYGNVIVEPWHVDHSTPGAYGFIIHTSSGTIIYTGDLRMHGAVPEMTREFVEKAKEAEPKVLIIEGTRVGRKEDKSYSEKQVGKISSRITAKTKNLVITTFYGKDIDRIKNFYKVAKENDRKFIVSLKTAHLLNKLKDDPKIKAPDPLNDNNIKIYVPRKKSGCYVEKDYYVWERPYLANSVDCNFVKENASKILLNLDLNSFTQLIDIKPKVGEFIHSMSEPFMEGGMDQIEKEIMMNWLKLFGLKFHQIHASGHSSINDLKTIVKTIDPKVVIPVHTQNAKFFKKFKIKTKIVRIGKEYKI